MESSKKLSSVQERNDLKGLLGEREARAYVVSLGLQPFDAAIWKPGTPLLYVHEDLYRSHPRGPFGKMSPEEVPHLALLTRPVHFEEVSGRSGGAPGRIVYDLDNDGAEVLHYHLDEGTHAPRLVLTERKRKAYQVTLKNLFFASEGIFQGRETEKRGDM